MAGSRSRAPLCHVEWRGRVARTAPRHRRMSMPGDDPCRVIAQPGARDPAAHAAPPPVPDRRFDALAGPSARAHGRPGYDASLERTLERVRPMLASEPVVWLSTVRPDGLPHLVPTWFWWDGEALRRVLQAGRREGPQPARQPAPDGRPRPARGGLLGRPDRGGGDARRGSHPRRSSSRSTRAGSRRPASIARRSSRPSPRRSASSRPGSSPGAAGPRATTGSRAGVRQPSLPEAPALAFRGTLLPAWA